MKKTISKAIIVIFFLLSIIYFSTLLIFTPCIRLYGVYGIVGIFSWLAVVLLTGLIGYILYKVINWALRNVD